MTPWTDQFLQDNGYKLQPDGSYAKPIAPTKRPSAAPPAGRVSHPKPQCATRKTLDCARPGKAERKARVIVRITRCAPRPLDADNFAGGCKPLIDQLRYAKLIPDDDPASVELQFAQKQITGQGKGWTEIEII